MFFAGFSWYLILCRNDDLLLGSFSFSGFARFMSCPPFCGKDVNHHPSNSSNLQLFFVIRLQGERASQTLFFLGKMNQTCYFPVILRPRLLCSCFPSEKATWPFQTTETHFLWNWKNEPPINNLSNEQFLVVWCKGWYYSVMWGLFHKPLYGSLLTNQYFMESIRVFFCGSIDTESPDSPPLHFIVSTLFPHEVGHLQLLPADLCSRMSDFRRAEKENVLYTNKTEKWLFVDFPWKSKTSKKIVPNFGWFKFPAIRKKVVGEVPYFFSWSALDF